MNVDIRTSWDIPTFDNEPVYGQGRQKEDFGTREELIVKVAAIGQRQRWTKQAMADHIGLSEGIFSGWFSRKYKGRFDTSNKKIETWLDGFEEAQDVEFALPDSPAFIETKIATEIMDMLQAARVLPAMNLITADAGIGKTMAAEHFMANNSNTWMVTISPHTKTIHGMLLAIADAVGLVQPNMAHLVTGIGKRVQKRSAPCLLIVDEAQNLTDDAINQLRHFTDQYKCGIALLGNKESYSRFAAWGKGTKYGQLSRRILKRLNKSTSYEEDLKAFIRAWGITDPKMTTYLIGIGKKSGAMGQIDMTIKLANLMIMDEGRPINLADVKRAWSNRDVEG
ncbi:MAG: AAA family ATPase [Rhizobiaceae bacterium]|nr:AAA family ATPase [Rhizobiaceae bacterium]